MIPLEEAIEQALTSDILIILIVIAFLIGVLFKLADISILPNDRDFTAYFGYLIVLINVIAVVTVPLGTLLGAERGSIEITMALIFVVITLWMTTLIGAFLGPIVFLPVHFWLVPNLVEGFNLGNAWQTTILVGFWELILFFQSIYVTAIFLWLVTTLIISAKNSASARRRLAKAQRQNLKLVIPSRARV